MPSFYEPAEDSFLLRKHIKDYARGLTLDVGTGSGIQAIEASRYAKKVIAVDINVDAIKAAENKAAEEGRKNIVFIKSDLFSALKGKEFDCIIFNPPYLPSDAAVPDEALDGGPKGHELINRFLDAAQEHLANDGTILILFSSQSKPHIIIDHIEELLYDYRLLDTQHIFFEDMFVYALKKSPLLLSLEARGIHAPKRFAHGKHGQIFVGTKGKAKVAVKMAKTEQFSEHIRREAVFLKELNRAGIGSKLIETAPDYFIYHFVEGERIIPFAKNASKKDLLIVLLDVMKQCRSMDRLGINKLEMTHPTKHVIVTARKKPVLIDFERCKKTPKPKNVTQFCQFLTTSRLVPLLTQKKITFDRAELLLLCKAYKESPDEKNYKRIVSLLR